MKYADVDPEKDWGEDEGSPDNEQAVWDWLVSREGEGLTLQERVAMAESLGRYDIVDEITKT